MHLTSKMLDGPEIFEGDGNSSNSSMLARKNTVHRNIEKTNWHCCRVTTFNFWRYWPKKCRPCKTDRKERILLDHYQKVEKEVHVTYILQQLRILKAITKSSITKKEWQRNKFEHGYLRSKATKAS